MERSNLTHLVTTTTPPAILHSKKEMTQNDKAWPSEILPGEAGGACGERDRRNLASAIERVAAIVDSRKLSLD
ncbi:hypothetical protein KIN20_033641 [Parelaphostrongylus tenuis]|uniref:Uncharacterized protein n=1 Tax=Parelaphostrongylus tenuis TaxID=148309 RepID=A0AAD5R906_PARTN|nr:hypothetical protein KIN20_033641 [Parelaphostrongylus tenuis]